MWALRGGGGTAVDGNGVGSTARFLLLDACSALMGGHPAIDEGKSMVAGRLK